MSYARRRSVHRLQLERLERRTLLSGTQFGESQVVLDSELADLTTVIAADLDGDGDQDALAASWEDNKVAWYENTDGAGTFGPQQVITTSANGALSVFAVDLDGDSDLDVLSASTDDDKIAWYENVDGAGTFSSQKVITTVANYASSVFAADLDGDGDQDVLSASNVDGKIAWYENLDGDGTFGDQQVIGTATWAVQALAADLDGDGDQDVLSASYKGKVAWHENTDGAGTFGPGQVIATNATGHQQVLAVDVDGDGDQDLLSASTNGNAAGHPAKIAWFENTDGAGTFGGERLVRQDVFGSVSIFAADMDADGDVDILATSPGDAQSAPSSKVVWYENTDGAGTFAIENVVSTPGRLGNPRSVSAADLDGDGDLDVLCGVRVDIVWYEDTDGTGTFGHEVVITSNNIGPLIIEVLAADLDGDKDQDLLATSAGDKLAWFENTDGLGTFGPQLVISRDFDAWPDSIGAVDLDGDGDLDVLVAAGLREPYTSKIVWYENTDGAGTFGSERVISRDVLNPRSIDAADLDGDGDLDVLSTTEGDNRIVWYENVDGAGSFGSQQVISPDFRTPGSVLATDLDGDGDQDVLAGSISGIEDITKIAWFENLDGAGTFAPRGIVAMDDSVSSIAVADLDGDGDLDVLSTSHLGREFTTLAWFENLDGAGTFGLKPFILRMVSERARASQVSAGDLDGDGDADVLFTLRWRRENNPNDWEQHEAVAWLENTDGAGNFSTPQVIREDVENIDPNTENFDNASIASSVDAADLDGDGDLDVLDPLAWSENLLAHPGDANRDGRFTSSDLVVVFEAGEYEDEIKGNSTWEEGDWNGDGDFDSGDLVAAFQIGLYEHHANLPTAAVATDLAAAVDQIFVDDEWRAGRRAYAA